MSAEPAHPSGPPGPTPAAKVLQFPTANRPPRRARREATSVPSDLTPQQKLAATLEARFAEHGRSLTDADTAADFLITLRTVRHMLEGALVEGVLDDAGHADLTAMIEGMMEAPGLLG